MSFQIKLNYGILSRDTQILGNMDPYCILGIGPQQYRSRTARGSGKKPIWFQAFRFDCMMSKLEVTVMDQDTLVDDLIGKGTIDLSKFRYLPGENKEFVELKFRGESCGLVQLDIKPIVANVEIPLRPNPFNSNHAYISSRFSGIAPTNMPPNCQPQYSNRMQNHGMQVLQGMNMNSYLMHGYQPLNNLSKQQQITRNKQPFNINGVCGKFKPLNDYQTNSNLRFENQQEKKENNPFKILQNRLRDQSGIKEKNPFKILQQALNARLMEKRQRQHYGWGSILDQIEPKQQIRSNIKHKSKLR